MKTSLAKRVTCVKDNGFCPGKQLFLVEKCVPIFSADRLIDRRWGGDFVDYQIFINYKYLFARDVKKRGP